MHPLHRLFGKCRFEPFELQEDFLPQTVGGDHRPNELRDEGPKVWYVGYRCVVCGRPGYKMGPIDL